MLLHLIGNGGETLQVCSSIGPFLSHVLKSLAAAYTCKLYFVGSILPPNSLDVWVCFFHIKFTFPQLLLGCGFPGYG
jgi:hypothetical protein